MSFNPFQQRTARVTVTVQRPDKTGAAQAFTYVFEQHRMRIAVRQGGQQYGNAKIEVFGVPLATMNNIARLWLEALTPQNTDSVAIDVWDGNGFVPFFQGIITWSAVDASAVPNVKLVIEANESMQLMNATASPYSNAGPVSLKDVLTAIAMPAGFAVDYSISAPPYQLTDQRVTGSPMEQIGAIMRQFPDLTWTSRLQRIIVRKANAPYGADPIRIADDAGKMGFPVYSQSGLQFSTLFDPRTYPGVGVNVESTFDYVNRTTWVASVLAHSLEPNLPGGQWTTSVAAISYGPKGNNQ